MSGLAGIVDGGWVDIGSSICATVTGLYRSVRHGADRNTVIMDFMNGGVLFPFIVMMMAVFSSSVLRAVEDSSRGTFFLAGGIGFVWVLSELRKA